MKSLENVIFITTLRLIPLKSDAFHMYSNTHRPPRGCQICHAYYFQRLPGLTTEVLEFHYNNTVSPWIKVES